MSRLEFYQTNYIAKNEDGNEIKICPFCKTVFSSQIDDCPKCKTFLPSFPTSWVRSATNIFLLRKVLEYIFFDLQGVCTVGTLTDLLTKNYIISFDHQREKDDKYRRGGPMRRASEYLSNLQYLGLILKQGDGNFYITQRGKDLVLAKDYSDYIYLWVRSFMELKIGNQFDTKGFYSSYNNHLLYLSIKIIRDLKNKGINPTMENIALAVMCKNESSEYNKAILTSLKYSHKDIRQYWFGSSQEFKRVIRGVFIRWLNQVKLITVDEKENTLFVELTELGNKIVNKYEKIYSSNEDFEQLSARLIELKTTIENNVDEKYLRLNLSSESNNRSGAERETIVKNNFNKIGLDVERYKKTLDFSNIKLPDEVLISLTGGTKHNPDLILKNPLRLIDPKKDVNMEMHKVYAYDKYGEIVDGLSIIVTQKIMKEEKVKMMKNLNLKNVFVLDGYALQVLSDNPDYFTKEKVISILNNCKNNIYYLTEEEVFDEYVN